MKIYYIFDALCGWCYGFNKPMKEFYSCHKNIEIEVISGGLFVGNRAQAIVNYPHIPGANARISAIFGVNFSENYQKMLEKWEIILNSYHPAAAFSILRNFVPNHELVALASDIQDAFFVEGKSLSDIETYLEITKKYDIQAKNIESELSEKFSKKYEFLSDFQKSMKMWVQGFPTLLLEKNWEFFDLKWMASTSENLEKNLQEILKN